MLAEVIMTTMMVIAGSDAAVAGRLVEERRRWPAICRFPARAIFKINSEFRKKGGTARSDEKIVPVAWLD